MTIPSEPTDVRFIGGIPSNLFFLDKMLQRTAIGEPVRCWTTSISPDLAVVATRAQVRRGQPVQLHLAEIGSIRGHMARPVEGGVAVDLNLDEVSRAHLAGKITWYRKRVLHSASDRREYKRRPPGDPNSILLLADATQIPCRILNVSRSGAAVAAPVQPEIGSQLALGQVVARVVNHIDDTGFAIQFVIVQDEDKLDEMVLPLPTWNA